MKPSNILVVGQFTNNRGDEAQGVALAHTMRSLMPDVKIRFMYFQNDYPVHEATDCVGNSFVRPRRHAAESLFAWMFKKMHPFIGMINEADVIVMPPGGPYIGDMYSVEHELIRAFVFHMAKKLNKKTMIYAPSMGPFRKGMRTWLHRSILKNADVICVRDRISHQWAESLKTGKTIHLTADSAIQKVLGDGEIRDLISKTNLPLPEDRIKVGITPIDLAWHPHFGKMKTIDTMNDSIVREFAVTIDQLIRKHDAWVYFYPQLFGMAEDLSVIEKIMDRVADLSGGLDVRDRMIVLSNADTADYQQAHISKMDCFIGTRYHSIVFSSMYAVPFISIYYEHKTEDLSRRLGMDDFCIPVNEMRADTILEKFDALIENRQKIAEHLSREMAPIRTTALKTSEYLHALCTKTH